MTESARPRERNFFPLIRVALRLPDDRPPAIERARVVGDSPPAARSCGDGFEAWKRFRHDLRESEINQRAASIQPSEARLQ